MSVDQTPKVERTHDGTGNPIGSLSGAIDVHQADVHIELRNRHFIDFDSATESPSVAIVAGDTVVLVADTTGFVVGGEIVIKDAGGDVREHHFVITAVVLNTSIAVDRPIDKAYTTSAVLEVVLINMNVVGSLAAPLVYEVTPPSDETWHLTRVIVSITDATAMDDAEFGGLGTTLTNGVTLRENKSSGTYSTITNWKNNGQMAEDMFNVEYVTRSLPAGSYGLRGRFTFTNAGAIIKLNGSTGDKLEILIQDDLTGLLTFTMKAQGHIEGT
jgi:hypothetical protein